MGWWDSFVHPEKAYKAGQGQLDKYFNQGQGYLQPYNQYGQNAYGDLSSVMKSLLDPQALEGKWSSGYNESQSAKNMEGMATEHGLDAASSMGLMGSSPALQAIQAGTSGIVADDRQNYMNNMMQKLLAGAGIAGNIFNMGANTAGSMATNANNMGSNSAGMAYGEKSSPGNAMGGLLGIGAGLAGSALGGPIGGALGGWLGNKLGGPWSTGGK